MHRGKNKHASPPKTCYKAMEPRTATKILKDQAECRKSLTFFIDTLEHDQRLLRNNLERERLMFSRQQARKMSTKSLCLPGTILKEYEVTTTGFGHPKHHSYQNVFGRLRQVKRHPEREEAIPEMFGATSHVRKGERDLIFTRHRRLTDVGFNVDQNVLGLEKFTKRSSSCLPPQTHKSPTLKKSHLPHIHIQHRKLLNNEPRMLRRNSLIPATDDVDVKSETVSGNQPEMIHSRQIGQAKLSVTKRSESDTDNAKRESKSKQGWNLTEIADPNGTTFRTIFNSKTPTGIRFNAPPSLRRKPVTAQRKENNLL